MDTETISKALAQAKESSKERKFAQRIDLIINFKELDLKKPDNHVDFFLTLPNNPGKPKRIAGFVDAELIDEAKANLAFYVTPDKFPEYANDKKKAKELANTYDYFIAQANIMKDVAGSFGRILGSRGKMPNPKGGMVVAPKTSLKPLAERLTRTVHIKVKTTPTYQAGVGLETQSTEEIAANIAALYEQIINHLPSEAGNVRSVFVKTTMGAPVRVI